MQTSNSNIDKIVEQLLHRHECVILPDFGGFIVRDSPCNFNATKDLLKPFAKHIFFNPHLTQNDGLLVSEIQKTESISYNEALEFCKSEIEKLQNEIELNSNKSFGKLGTFHKGQSNVWFAPNSNINLSIESYGLAPISINQVHSVAERNEELAIELKDKTSESIPDKTPIVSLEIPKRGLKPWLVAASVALLAHFIYLGIENKTNTAHEASVLPTIEVSKPSLDTQIDQTSVESIDTALNTEISAANSDVKEVETSVDEAPEPFLTEPIEQIPNTQTEKNSPQITLQTIARYRIEANAKYHASDLNKKGQSAEITQDGIWYEVKIVQ